METLEQVRARHQELAWSRLGDRMESRLVAPGAARDRELAEQLEWVRAHSRWHAPRLDGVERLADAPVMTKADLMANWDDVCTDPRITLAAAEAHLETSSTLTYLAGDVTVVASGGSSGQRGVFAWGWEDLAQAQAVFIRWLANLPQPEGEPVRVMIGAAGVHHLTSCLLITFPLPGGGIIRLPATMPLDQIVAELNATRPTTVGAYSSIAHALALEALAGRLHIDPVGVSATAEPLLPEARDAIRDAWGVEAVNIYGTSEVSAVAQGCGKSAGMHLNEDAVIVEVEDGRILVTSLINRTLPLIRYEMTDEVTLLDESCSCGSPFRLIADVHGRADDWFEYASGAKMHPHGLRSVLTKTPNIIEYQVRQTPGGADVDVRTTGRVETADLARRITASLEQSGVTQPVVNVQVVDEIPRVGIGKLKRFVPLH